MLNTNTHHFDIGLLWENVVKIIDYLNMTFTNDWKINIKSKACSLKPVHEIFEHNAKVIHPYHIFGRSVVAQW